MTLRFDRHPDCILITVHPYIADFEHIARRSALVPDFRPGPAVEMGFSGLQTEIQRFAIHVRHHQGRAVACLRYHGRNQTFVIEFRH